MNKFLNYNLIKYPKYTYQDIIKLLYQSVFGGKHMLNNIDKAKEYLFHEALSLEAVTYFEPIYEYISEDYVRINLRPYIKYGFSLEELFSMFYNSAISNEGNIEMLHELLFEVSDDSSWVSYVKEYIDHNYPVYHHSLLYSDNYKPHYRIVSTKYISNEMKEIQISSFLENCDNQIIGIDGKCGVGKTYLSNMLSNKYNMTVFHIDDFFLNFSQRKLFNKYNFDLNRVITFMKTIELNNKNNFEKYDCSSDTYIKKEVITSNNVIFEGVYSLCDELINYYNKTIIIIESYNTRINRLKERTKNNDILLNKFLNEWIPKEDLYFNNLSFDNIDLIV